MPPGVRGGRTGRRWKRAAALGERRERLCALSEARRSLARPPAPQWARQNQEREPLDEGVRRLSSLADVLPSKLAGIEEEPERLGVLSLPPGVRAGRLSAFFGRRSSRFGRLRPFPERLSLDRSSGSRKKVCRGSLRVVPRACSFVCASSGTAAGRRLSGTTSRRTSRPSASGGDDRPPGETGGRATTLLHRRCGSQCGAHKKPHHGPCRRLGERSSFQSVRVR